jgi:hypothetical protein
MKRPSGQVAHKCRSGLVQSGETVMAGNDVQHKRGGWSWWYLLFVVQWVIVLWPPFYNKAEPYWIGIPFFYWYQLLWVIIGAVFTAVVYFATED